MRIFFFERRCLDVCCIFDVSNILKIPPPLRRSDDGGQKGFSETSKARLTINGAVFPKTEWHNQMDRLFLDTQLRTVHKAIPGPLESILMFSPLLTNLKNIWGLLCRVCPLKPKWRVCLKTSLSAKDEALHRIPVEPVQLCGRQINPPIHCISFNFISFLFIAPSRLRALLLRSHIKSFSYGTVYLMATPGPGASSFSSRFLLIPDVVISCSFSRGREIFPEEGEG